MRSILFIATLLIVGVFLLSKQEIDLPRNHLVFENDINNVADSIKRMENLMNKFPDSKTGIVNYFVDYSGYLYLNSEKTSPLKGAIDNPKVRNDKVFVDFSEKEIDEFFYLMAYLWRNYITTCSREPSINHFIFSYRVKENETSENGRFVIMVHQQRDTTSTNFKRFFKVIDNKEGLALIRSK